jgi:hypothetical protein
MKHPIYNPVKGKSSSLLEQLEPAAGGSVQKKAAVTCIEGGTGDGVNICSK